MKHAINILEQRIQQLRAELAELEEASATLGGPKPAPAESATPAEVIEIKVGTHLYYLLGFLSSKHRGASVTELCHELDESRGTISATISTAVRRGILVRIARGVYKITPGLRWNAV